MKVGAVILGLVFAAIAIVYFAMPAQSLPSFFPGFEPGSAHVHTKHGIASAVVAVALFGVAWLTDRSRR